MHSQPHSRKRTERFCNVSCARVCCTSPDRRARSSSPTRVPRLAPVGARAKEASYAQESKGEERVLERGFSSLWLLLFVSAPRSTFSNEDQSRLGPCWPRPRWKACFRLLALVSRTPPRGSRARPIRLPSSWPGDSRMQPLLTSELYSLTQTGSRQRRQCNK